MRVSLKRASNVVLGLCLLLFALFFPPFPWSARCEHARQRMIASLEMKLARWRGHEPRLLSIAGKLNVAGAQVEALDSRSGWATVTDSEGRFILPDLMWYPGETYDLVISTDGDKGTLNKISAPQGFPEGGIFSIEELKLDQGKAVDLSGLPGVNTTTYEYYDVVNKDYYEELIEKITTGKRSDEEKIDAINDYVATKLNYEETQWELGSPRRILERGSQYCGHLSEAMATLLATGGYRVRTVNLTDGKNPPGTHVVVEVFYAGAWHLYDPTYGVKFLKKDGSVASYKDVRLDTSVITEDLFVRFKPNKRRELAAWLPTVYDTGFHHFYGFKDK